MKRYPTMYQVLLTKTCYKVLRHTQINVILELCMVGYVFVMRKRDQKNIVRDTVQRSRAKEDAAQLSWGTNRLDV